MFANFRRTATRPQLRLSLRLIALAALGALALAHPTASFAAAGPRSSRVAGRVVDPAGSLVAGARVTLSRQAVGFERAVTTAGDGRYSFGELVAAEYLLEVRREGFSVSARPLRLTPGETLSLDVVLWQGRFSEEVNVSAARVAGNPEEVRRIPGAVEVLDRDALESSRVFTTSEALRKVSGVHVRDEEGFGLRPNIGIRGLNPTRSSKVLLLEDGIPVTYAPYGDNASYYHPPVERFERIEVLKGSGQIAYGPSTVGGVVNYVTADPPAKPSGSVTVEGGERAFFNGRLSYGGTWGGGSPTGIQLDYLRKQGDGARENVHSELDDVVLKLTREIGPRQALTLRANYYGENSRVTYSGLTEAEWAEDPRQNPFENDQFDGRRWGGSATHAFRLSEDVLLTTNLYASQFERNWWRQSSNSAQRPNDSSDPACGGMQNLNTTCGNEGRLRRYRMWGVEPRARVGHRLFGVPGEAQIGLRAHFEDQERRQVNGETPDARSGRLVENNGRENAAFSAFAQNRFRLGRFTVTPGVRVERIFYERTNRLGRDGAGVSGRTALTQLVPGLGVSWEAAAGTTVFAGAHRGFAPPRTEDVISNSTGAVVDLDPELSWNWELGARSRLAPGVEVDATLFRMDYENQVVPASLAGGIGATLTNGGETLHEGAELSARLDTAPLTGSAHDVFVRLAWTWLPIAEFRGERFSGVTGFGNVRVTGNRLPYAPEHLVTGGIGYRHPSGLEGLLEAVHIGEQFGDDLNSRVPSPDGQRGLLPGHTLWNATVSCEVSALRSALFVTVKNLFDRTVIVDRSRGILPGSPRLVQAGVKVRL